MIPLDATAVLAVVCALVACGAGGYLLGYLEGKAHGLQDARDEADERWRDAWED